jgi:autotransporter-associated beta strand protein
MNFQHSSVCGSRFAPTIPLNALSSTPDTALNMNKNKLDSRAPRTLSRFLTIGMSIASFALVVPQAAQATALTWGSAGAGGTGTWDLNTTANWYNGTSDQTWTDSTGASDTATFAGTAGTVTVGTNLGALGLILSTTGYTIATGSNTLTVGSSGIDASALASGTTTITGNLALGGDQTWNTGSGSTLAVSSTIDNGGHALTSSSAGIDSLTGVISGAGSIVKSGSGITALNATNTYSGGTSISAGLLAVGTVTGSSQTVPAAGSATINTASLGSAAVTVNTGGTLGLGFSTSNVGWNSGAYTYANNVTLNGGGINVLDGQTVLSGAITVGASGGFIKSTYGTDHNKGVWLDGGLAGSGTLDTGFTYYNRTNNVTYAGSSVFVSDSSSGFTGTVNVNPTLNGTNGVFNQGGSYLWLSSTNAMANATLNITGGNYGSKVQYGSSPLLFVAGVTSYTIGGLSGADTLILTNRNYYDRTGVQITTGGQAVALSIGNNNANTTYAGVISGSGSITKIGTGAFTLSGVNTYSGGTTVNAGTLNLSGGGASGRIRGALTINSGATVTTSSADAFGYTEGAKVNTVAINGGTLDNSAAGNQGFGVAYTLTGGSMSSSGGGAFVFGQNSGGTTPSVTTLASATTSTISGPVALRSDNGLTTVNFTVADGSAATDLQVSGIISSTGSVGIAKLGAGTMTLSGANTYTGATTISEGTIALASGGSLASTSLSIAAGATLDVSAQASYSLASNTITLTLDGSSMGLINAGALAVDFSSAALTLNVTTGTPGASYDFLSSTSAATGNLASVSLEGSFSGSLTQAGDIWSGTSGGFNFSLDQTSGALTITAVPEPHEFALAIVALLGVMVFIRRRNQQA